MCPSDEYRSEVTPLALLQGLMSLLLKVMLMRAGRLNVVIICSCFPTDKVMH